MTVLSMKFCLFVLSLIFLPLTALAQVGFEAQNDLQISPAYPEPGAPFTVTVDDYAGGLFGAQISWFYNGSPVPQSLNQRSITLDGVDLGQTGTVEAVFLTQQGVEQSIKKTIKPIYFDFIIEAQTHTPDWYEGRALPSYGSQVNATVLVDDGQAIDPTSLIYSWTLGNKPIHGGPVRGQHKTSFAVPRGNDVILSVSASRVNGEVLATRAIRIPIVSPSLYFFERHSLYGVRKFPVQSSLSLIGNTVLIEATPFNLDSRVYNNPDIYDWEIDRTKTDNGNKNPYQISLQPAGGTGTANVNFHVRSLENLTQGVEEAVSISFN